MASSPAEMEKIIVKAIKDNTGKDYKAWYKLMKNEAPEKYREQIQWLKVEKGLKHGQASVMASIFKNGGDLVYGDPAKLINEQYSGKCANMRPLFDELNKTIQNNFADAELHVCKGYVSFVAKTQFATIHPGKDEIKLGLAFRDHPAKNDLLQVFKVKNASDKITHYVSIKSNDDINQQLIDLVAEVKAWYS